MGRVIVNVEIVNPKNGKSINVRLLVDTGSTLTWIKKERASLEKENIASREA